MKKSLLASVAAAALFAFTGFAGAQGTSQGRAKGGEAPTAASPKSDSGGGSSMSRESSGSQAKDHESGSGRAEGKSGTNSTPQTAHEKDRSTDTKSSTKTSGEMNKNSNTKSSADTPASGNTKSDSATETHSGSKTGSSTAETKSGSDTKSGSKTGNSTAETKSGSDTKSGSKTGDSTAETKSGSDTKSGSTTGNAATSATAAPPAEKRTQITSAIKQEKVEETTNVNFNISVGATVPAHVHFHPLPARVVEVYPEWRGYDFILVHGRYIIVRPQTHEIVYIIEG
jgi:hypothetical protein